MQNQISTALAMVSQALSLAPAMRMIKILRNKTLQAYHNFPHLRKSQRMKNFRTRMILQMTMSLLN